VDGKQIRKFDATWDKDGARAALVARLGSPAPGQLPPEGGELPLPTRSEPGLTFGAAVSRYLKAKARKKSIANDARHLRRLMAVFGADTPLRAITASRISAWKEDRLVAVSPKTKRAYSAAGINRPLAVLRHLLRLAHESWEVLPARPRISLEKEAEGRVVWLEPAREAELVAACRRSRNAELYALVLLAIETGMRLSEILGLTWPRVDFSRNVIVLSSRTTKSDRRREIPMRQAVYDLLAGAPGPRHGPLFRSRRWASYRTAWETIAATIPTAPDGEPLTFHGLRHHFASWFMMRGGRVESLQKILGHATLTMTMRYAHLAPDYLRAEMTRTDASMDASMTRFSAHSSAHSAILEAQLPPKSLKSRGSSVAEQLIRNQ
jgi:integrase